MDSSHATTEAEHTITVDMAGFSTKVQHFLTVTLLGSAVTHAAQKDSLGSIGANAKADKPPAKIDNRWLPGLHPDRAKSMIKSHPEWTKELTPLPAIPRASLLRETSTPESFWPSNVTVLAAARQELMAPASNGGIQYYTALTEAMDRAPSLVKAHQLIERRGYFSLLMQERIQPVSSSMVQDMWQKGKANHPRFALVIYCPIFDSAAQRPPIIENDRVQLCLEDQRGVSQITNLLQKNFNLPLVKDYSTSGMRLLLAPKLEEVTSALDEVTKFAKAHPDAEILFSIAGHELYFVNLNSTVPAREEFVTAQTESFQGAYCGYVDLGQLPRNRHILSENILKTWTHDLIREAKPSGVLILNAGCHSGSFVE